MIADADADEIAQRWFERWQMEGSPNLATAVAELLRTDRKRRALRIRHAARSIALDLFTDGQGHRARRLVMDYAGKAGGTGWSEQAVVARVTGLLASPTRPKLRAVPGGKAERP